MSWNNPDASAVLKVKSGLLIMPRVVWEEMFNKRWNLVVEGKWWIYRPKAWLLELSHYGL